MTLRLQCFALASLMSAGKYVKDTMIGKLVNLGISPVEAAFNRTALHSENCVSSGLHDSLRFIKPWSDGHVMAKLLTKAF